MFLTDMHTRLTGQATVVDAVAGDHGASGCASGSDSQSSVATDLQDQDC